jgi:hypothetical protein
MHHARNHRRIAALDRTADLSVPLVLRQRSQRLPYLRRLSRNDVEPRLLVRALNNPPL